MLQALKKRDMLVMEKKMKNLRCNYTSAVEICHVEMLNLT